MEGSQAPSPEARPPGIENVLGPLGAAVMRVVWQQGAVSVSDVVDALNARRERPLAYTTVMTIMVRLSERRLLQRERAGRMYVYRPAGDEQAVLETMSSEAIDGILARYGTTALVQFAERLADVDPDVRDRMLEIVAQRVRRPPP